jgi:8-oxo-dGTP diphosphatase
VRLIRVVAALVARDGHVLIARRVSPPAWAGWWEFPGGKVEAGEADAAALERECLEELGAQVHTGAPLVTVFHDEPDRRIAISVYRATLTHGEPVAKEHDALAWVPIAGLPTYNLLPADLVVLQALADAGD